MKQEKKELLLKDLCARLPYMPKIKITYQQQGIKGIDEGKVSCDFIEKIVNDLRNGVITNMQIYLRPMSSMTEEEEKEYSEIFWNRKADYIGAACVIDWLLEHHFDFRNLINKGLAIDCTNLNIY